MKVVIAVLVLRHFKGVYKIVAHEFFPKIPVKVMCFVSRVGKDIVAVIPTLLLLMVGCVVLVILSAPLFLNSKLG